MRILLSTLAILTIAAPAYANDLDRDPEGSIRYSNTIANESPDASVSQMEPAAGTEAVKEYKAGSQRPAKAINKPEAKIVKNIVNQHDDVEGTVTPSRTVE